MDIYFGASITGGRENQASAKELIEFLKSFGTVLTEHVGDPGLSAQGEAKLDGKTVHERDVAWLEQAQVVIAEVTTPSLGVGYELGRAVALGKPILCLFNNKSGRTLSRIISGSEGISTKNYESMEEAKQHIEEFFKKL
ncbi:MAG: nucleoside 2-deoxyribosyltransferase [Candidatus Woesearchaeota archaeon]|nr:MAG: nucleoside 2-deoxyribosyltransferase [Candidatus Woesearchaeota archaeon]